MDKNQNKLLGALVAVVGTSLTAAFGIVPGKAQAEGQPGRSVLDGGTFTVLRHEKDAEDHAGALIMVLATKEDQSEYALAFMTEDDKYPRKGMACRVTTRGDRSLRCVSDPGRENVIEVLTVGDAGSGFCTKLHSEHGGYDNAENPIMLPEDCEAEYPDKPDAACICYQIEHFKPAIALNGDTEDTDDTIEVRIPPGRGSGSGGHD